MQGRFQQGHVAGSERNGEQGQDAATTRQPERDELISEIGTIIWELPNTIQCHLKRHEDSSGGNKKNHKRDDLGAMARAHQSI